MSTEARQLPPSGGTWRRLLRHLPEGSTLPRDVWAQRHRRILGLLWLHVPAVLVFALARGETLAHGAVESSVIAALAATATMVDNSRRLATVAAAVGLLTCSAMLVHLADGQTEMHFHYFVMVGVVTLYQDWWPFLIAIGYVVVQHGVAGVVAPEVVYSHQAAVESPWLWAGVHGAFILGMSSAGIASWKLNELALRATADKQEELRDALSLLSATLDATADGILVVDDAGRITSYNERFVELWRIPAEILDSRDDDRALAYVVSQIRDPEAFTAKVRELYAQPEAESRDVIEFVDGRIVERCSKPQRVGGTTVGRVWSFRDVTERHRLEDELAHQAFHDSLTDLANQALFRDRVEHAVARAGDAGVSMAVLFVDLDNFKTVNDSLGHTAGDALLVAVAARLRSSLRPKDTAARLGGDEFTVLLEDLDGGAEAVAVADQLAGELRRPFAVGGREVVVTPSIGIAFGGQGVGADQLLRNADLAMYTAKRRGKNRCEVFEARMHEAAVDRLEIEADLRHALENSELTVHYQPIVALPSGAISGVEALVRWEHPVRGRLAPDRFIPLAEETGLVCELGRQVLERACADVQAWRLRHDRPLSVSVNLSPRQLQDDRLLECVSGALAASGLPASALVLEITEGAMMHDTDASIAKLHALKGLGVRLAVDDFGTGYSSLSYLQRFPIDVLKIDRSFVSSIESNDESSSLARTIVSLAATLKLQAVAEGIETEGQRDALSALGCDLAQGYYFAEPMDASALDELLIRTGSVRGPRT